MTQFTIPGMTDKQAIKIAGLLQKQLSTYNDLHLTLKHIHWNVVGPNFIGVHEMIDPQVELVRGYADEVAERIATLGGSPQGTRAQSSKTAPGTTTPLAATPSRPTWPHLTWSTTVSSKTPARPSTKPKKLDPVTQDILIDQAAELEKFQWFVRAHLENAGGKLAHEGSSTERSAAKSAKRKS